MTVGRGGKRGKTSGRGTKGQKARAGHKIRPALRDVIKKLPRRRGVTVNKRGFRYTSVGAAPMAVSLPVIAAAFGAGDTVSPATLIEKGLVRKVRGRVPKVKVLGGAIDKKLSIEGCLVSAGAKAEVEKAGGTVV